MLLSLTATSQEKYKLRPNFVNASKDELMKNADSLFYFQGNISYNITLDHIKPYKDIQADRTMQPGYLEKQLKQIAVNPSNFEAYGNAALYYQNKGDAAKAKEYYSKARTNLKMLPKAKDSASYYSYRGILKLNLEENGLPDIERALAINKTDSVAMVFYPMFLIQTQRYNDARKVLVNAISDPFYMKYSYFLLYLTDFYETLSTLPPEKEALIAALRKIDIATATNKDYDKYIDKKDAEYYKIKQMAELFYCIMKFGPGMDDKNFKPDPADVKFVNAKETYFKSLLNDKKSNAYGVYASLGTIAFLKKDYTQSIAYYEKALEAFPKDKEGFRFNTVEIYNNMATAYHQDKKYDKITATLSTKLEVKVISAEERKSTLLNLARLNFERGNYDQADDYIRKAIELGENFETDIMLSHSSLKQESIVLSERYREKAMRLMTEADACTFGMYMTSLYITVGQLDIAQEFYQKNLNLQCMEVKKMLDRYLVLKK